MPIAAHDGTMPRMTHIRTIAIAAALSVGIPVTVVATTGCPALVAAIPAAADIAADGLTILSLIETAVASWFTAHPLQGPVNASIQAALVKAKQALVTGEQALAGVRDLTVGNEAAAFAAFAAAYQDLMALVAPLGIVPAQPFVADAGTLTATQAPVLAVPTPLALRVTRTK